MDAGTDPLQGGEHPNPRGLATMQPDLRLGGSYLELRDGLLFGVQFAPPKLKQKAKLYLCGTSVEHVESAQGSIFWVVGFKRGKRDIKGLDEVEAWAGHYGLGVTRLAEVPERVRTETEAWFVDSAYDYAWFDVNSDDEGVGFHYAVVVYLAYHLQWAAGPRMFCMHLVADIEGKPNARHLWYRR
jgi:hypothetical protein